MPLTVPPGLTSPLSADLDFNSHKGTNVTDPTSPQDEATKNYVDQAISAISQNSGSGVISGCGVAWSGTGLVFDVSSGTYSINGTTYTLSAQQVTLAAADPSNPRIDLIIANTSSVADKITGTASQNPVAPSVDPATQLQLTFVYVPAGATTPNVSNTLLYDENVGAATEWNTSSSGSTWALGSTNNPHSGSKDIEATSVGTNAYAQLQKGTGTVDPSTFNSLVFWIRSKATWASNRSLTIALLNAGTQYGNAVSLRDGVLGFSSSNTTGYQQIVIPISSFNVNANLINQVRFIVAGTGGSIGFYLDTINLQAGVNINTQNFEVWRGAWSSTTAYVKNDEVVVNGTNYVCLIPNSNSLPTSSNTNWQAKSSSPSAPISYSSSIVVPVASSLVLANSVTLSAGAGMTVPSGSYVFVNGRGSAPTLIYSNAPNLPYNVATTSYTQVLTSATPALSAGDSLTLEVWSTMANNTAGSRTYFFQLTLGAVTIFDSQNQSTFGTSATNQCPFRMKFIISISSSSSWRAYFENDVMASGASVAAGVFSSGIIQTGWNSGSNDFTGAQTLTLKAKSDAVTATQIMTLHAYEVRRKPQIFY